MTVESSARSAISACNGVTQDFAVPFEFADNGALAVYLLDSNVIDLDGLAPLTEGLDYTITGDGRSGTAGIHTATAYPAGKYLLRWRSTAITQSADYVPFDGFPAETHERALDRLTMIAQEQRDDATTLETRTLLVPAGATAPPVADLAGKAGKVLALVDGRVDAIDNDPAGAAESAAQALASQIAAGASAEATAADAEQTGSDREAVADDKAAVEVLADLAQLGAITQRFYPGARSYVPQGAMFGLIDADAITPGSGGTDGTFALAFTGGNMAVDPTGSFTVSSGAVTKVLIDGMGLYIGAALELPTPDFSASAGLTGAAATLTAAWLVSAGEYYITDHATDELRTSLFQNQANAAVLVQADFGPADTALAKTYALQAAASAILPVTLTSSDANDLTGTTVNGVDPAKGQAIVFFANATNTDAPSLALNGGDPRPITTNKVTGTGALPAAGQIQNGQPVVAVRSTGGGAYNIIGPLPGTDADAKDLTSLFNYINGSLLQSAYVALNAQPVVRVLRDWPVAGDHTKRLVTLSEAHSYGQSGTGSPFWKAAAAVDVEVPQAQSILVDTQGSLNENGRLTPFVAAWVSSSRKDNRYICLYTNVHGQAGNETIQPRGGRNCYGDGDRRHRMNDVIVDVAHGSGDDADQRLLSIMLPGAVNGNQFIEYRFTLAATTSPDADHVAPGYGYHVTGVYAATYSETYDKARITQIARTAVFEIALKTVDASGNFVGGNVHGNQEMDPDSIVMLLDGVPVDPDATGSYGPGHRFEVRMTSTLYRWGELPDGDGNWTSTQSLGTVATRWIWEKGEMFIEQTFTCTNAFQMPSADGDGNYTGGFFLAMLPWWDVNDDDVTIITTGERWPSLGVEDITAGSDYDPVYSKATIMRGWGSGGYLMEYELLNPEDFPNRSAYFAPTVNGKPYIDLLGPDAEVSPGDVIAARYRYRIVNAN